MNKKLKPPKTEKDIQKHWKYQDKIYISCVCITYNHEVYVRDTIDSMLAQISDYKFEILIHDDLSTDKTREILFSYKERYPSIIKLILQSENQYSKGKKITPIALKYTSGEYIALCEGDDYWCDENKISMQMSMLLKYPTLSLSVHDSYVETNDGYKFSKWSSKPCIIKYGKIFKSSNQFSPTASMFFKKAGVIEAYTNYSDIPVGDFLLEIFLGKNGVHYLPKKMSVYRRGVVGSWTDMTLSNIDNKINHCNQMIIGLNKFKDNLPKELKPLVDYKISSVYHELAIALLPKNFKLAFISEMRTINIRGASVKKICAFFIYAFKLKVKKSV